MTDHTLNLIYAIKKSGKSWNQAVSEYMSAYSGSPIERYDEYSLNHILREAYCDYISTCDNPAMEARKLLEMMDNYPMYSRAHHLANCMGLAQVKDKGKFVNGFREYNRADFNSPDETIDNPIVGVKLNLDGSWSGVREKNY